MSPSPAANRSGCGPCINHSVPHRDSGDSATAVTRVLSEGSRNGVHHHFPPLSFLGPLNIRCTVQWGREAARTSSGPGSVSSPEHRRLRLLGPGPAPFREELRTVPGRGGAQSHTQSESGRELVPSLCLLAECGVVAVPRMGEAACPALCAV
ncbi:hypothetical protein SKAU_G00207200 [Synaphobranchus kaupii]|uniref:Uncharacterized protein n=1 Tax=Synaphobranchus kaupii TaxID=118154 RepID=A0A9Q1F847_SYNKA|nr:hypothetical protein SKAU_G00207200 [Synaphobranchus kaupii]